MSEDFLEILRSHRRAPLKVYLGMAAGVGKTVAMLREGKRLAAEGIDVVCGVVETHGRTDTAQELEGVVALPQRMFDYHGVALGEMDLDAILARRPAVVLVDELAHTNVPGSENEKRWEDVEVLLERGISVIATLNIQHLESLHEIVLRETGVDVRERIPDRVVQEADEVVVVDLPPAELQQRLRDGKVYPPEKVEYALRRFFTEKNLVALRQLALREVANGVERRGRTTHASGATSLRPVDAERVMVSMSSRPGATRRLLRHGARLAGGLNSKWFVVYVRTPSESPERIDSASLRSLTENLRLAKELGAEAVRLEGLDVVALLTEFARAKGITHAVFGRTGQSRWRERLRGSVLLEFMRAMPEVDVVGGRRTRVMSRRILIIESDASVRRMAEIAVRAGGFAPLSIPSIEASRAMLDGAPIEAVVVDLRATNTDGVASVRALRQEYPSLPLIVTGTWLTTSIVQDLLRLRVDDVLAKPFTPRDLIDAIQRVVRDVKSRADGATEYASAMTTARGALLDGRLGDVEAPLERARAASPLDAEAMALYALSRELLADDRAARRGYNAAVVLAGESVTDDAGPFEGLARLQIYGSSRRVAALDTERGCRVWLVADPCRELALGTPDGGPADVTIFALGLAANETTAIYARAAAEPGHGYLIATGVMTDRLAARVLRTFDHPIVLAHPRTLESTGSLE